MTGVNFPLETRIMIGQPCQGTARKFPLETYYTGVAKSVCENRYSSQFSQSSHVPNSEKIQAMAKKSKYPNSEENTDLLV